MPPKIALSTKKLSFAKMGSLKSHPPSDRVDDCCETTETCFRWVNLARVDFKPQTPNFKNKGRGTGRNMIPVMDLVDYFYVPELTIFKEESFLVILFTWKWLVQVVSSSDGSKYWQMLLHYSSKEFSIIRITLLSQCCKCFLRFKEDVGLVGVFLAFDLDCGDKLMFELPLFC